MAKLPKHVEDRLLELAGMASKGRRRKSNTVVDAADRISKLCELAGMPLPVRELWFAKGRRWRADCVWPEQGLFVEIHGGVHTGGRHTTGAGLTSDVEKMRAAALLGWRVAVFTADEVEKNSERVRIQLLGLLAIPPLVVVPTPEIEQALGRLGVTFAGSAVAGQPIPDGCKRRL